MKRHFPYTQKLKEQITLEIGIVVLIFLTVFYSNYTSAQTEGPQSGGTFVNDVSFGVVAWVNSGNATPSDDNYGISFGVSTSYSNYLKATNFGFAVPAGSTIDGIEVTVERSTVLGILGNDVGTASIRLVQSDVISGNDLNDIGTAWTTADAIATYGSSTNLWGLGWTDADINSVNFGVAIAAGGTFALTADARIDDIQIKVYYSAGLPIELLSFIAKQSSEKEVLLNWKTATETNNDYFTVERSVDAQRWDLVSNVKGVGNSSSPISYSTLDKNPYPETSYYRLKQTDLNGNSKIFPEVAVHMTYTSDPPFKIYPNPSTGETVNVSLAGAKKDDEVLVILYNKFGEEVYSKVLLQEGNISAIDTFNKLPSGVYLVIGTNKNSIYRQRLVIE